MHSDVVATGLILMFAAFLIFWMELSNPATLVSFGLSGLIMGFGLPPLLGAIGFIMFVVGLVINPKVTVIQQSAPAYDRPDFRCPKCRNPVSSSYNLCPYCGNKLLGASNTQADSQAPVGASAFCGYCGKTMKADLKFCTSCGKPIAIRP